MILLTGLPDRARRALARSMVRRAARARSRPTTTAWLRWAWWTDPEGAQRVAALKRGMTTTTTTEEETVAKTATTTIVLSMTEAQKEVLDSLGNAYVAAQHRPGEHLLAYVVTDDRAVELFNVAPDGSYTYESMVDGMHHGWTAFDEQGREVEADEDGRYRLVPDGRTDPNY